MSFAAFLSFVVGVVSVRGDTKKFLEWKKKNPPCYVRSEQDRLYKFLLLKRELEHLASAHLCAVKKEKTATLENHELQESGDYFLAEVWCEQDTEQKMLRKK